MTSPDFSGAEAKAARAFDHLKALDEEMSRFFATHQYGIGGQYDPQTAKITLYATELGAKFPVLDWGARIGDCLHNLRSALDHAVWQLALLHMKREPKDWEARRIQFPIEDTEDRFKEARVRPFLAPTHFGWLDQYQPYKSGDRAAYHKLAILRDLSNIDKHRVVHAAAVVPAGADLDFTDTSGVVSFESIELHFGKPLKPHTPMGVVNGVVVDRPDPKMEAYGPIQFGVVFDDPPRPAIHEEHVLHVLGEIGGIADGIVGWIAHQFTPTEPGPQQMGAQLDPRPGAAT